MKEIRTGRALQLEGLQYAINKVTLGFKCEAQTKIALAQEAQQVGMTLSEYVETVISSRNHQVKSSEDGTSELMTTVASQQKLIDKLKTKVNFYENDLLRRAFHNHRGQTIEYNNSHGKIVSKTISQIEDVFTVLLDTVKLS